MVLDDHQKDLVAQRQQKSLAQITTIAGFAAGLGTLGVMALAALVFNGLHLAGWAIVPFFLTVCTASGWFFGKVGAKIFLKKRE